MNLSDIELPLLISETQDILADYIPKVLPPFSEETFETSDPQMLIKNPLVSVPILAYNHERYLRCCLDSVLSQRVSFPYEIILSEDCSKDKTREICFEYQRRFPDKIRVLWSNRNVGLVQNVIRMHARDRGSIVCSVPGDDFWASPYRMQKVVDFLTLHPDVSVVHCGAYTQLENIRWTRCPSSVATKRNRLRIADMPQEQQGIEMLRMNYITGPTGARRIDALRYASDKLSALQKFVGWVPSEDFPSWFYMSQVGKIAYLPEDLVVYRMNAGSITANRDRSTALTREFGDVRATLGIVHMEHISDPVFLEDLLVEFFRRYIKIKSLKGEALKSDSYCSFVFGLLKDKLAPEYFAASKGVGAALSIDGNFGAVARMCVRRTPFFMVAKRIAMALLRK